MLKMKSNGRRRGSMCILVAVLLTVLIGITAIAVDGGVLQDNKRRLQATSDAAALAAASKLFQNYPTIVATNTADPGGQAKAAALAVAANNGFANDGAITVVTVNIPPASGPFTGKLGYAEVIITNAQPRYFSTIFGSSSIPITSRSVALGRWVGSGKGIIVLDPTVKNALNSTGNGAITVTGGAAVNVNSNNAAAAADVSGGGSATANQFNVTGGATGVFNGTVTTGTPPIPDPLAYLPLPTAPPDGVITKKSLGKGNTQYTLTPGRYTNLPSFQSGDLVILQQASANSNGGIFYLDGTTLTSQGASIIMDPTTSGGVMIYNNPASGSNNQGINITGNASGNVNLSAVTSGPYAGILFFQNRTATQTMTIQGNGAFSLSGTFYAANALLNISGNGTATIGSQYISRTLGISGGGNVFIDYTDNGTARERDIYLVE
jgi:Flp pilus assembly protein TadG